MDDCSITDEHLNYASQYKPDIVQKSVRGGVAKSKNTGIRKCLEYNAELIFLSDDDVLFIDKDWYNYYEEAYEATYIDHISYALSNSAQKNSKITKINDYEIRQTICKWVLFIYKDLLIK